jgi:uncharacterized repeat protein (TIGR01451 family)
LYSSEGKEMAMNATSNFKIYARRLVKFVIVIVLIITFVNPRPATPVQAGENNISSAASKYKITWATMAPMPTARAALGVAVATNGKIYAIGGDIDGVPQSTVEEYDPVTNTWAAKAAMPTARSEIGVVGASNGKVYVFGGMQYNPGTGTWKFLATVEEYNPVTDHWAAKTSMPAPRFTTAVAEADNGKIYVIGGGADIGGCLQTVGEYDPVSDHWTKRLDMPTARSGMRAAFANGMIYVIGGQGCPFQELNTVEAYNPGMNTWQTIASMPTGRGQLTVVTASNGRIYAIGGKDNNQNVLNTVEEYDPLADSWTGKAGMPTARWLLGAAATTDGKIYAMGGSTSCCSTSLIPINEQGTIQEIFCSQPPANLVSWWPGQNDANDMKGKNNGTLMNGATFAPGMVGQAFSFDGSDDYVTVPDSPGLNPVNGLTVSAWVKPNSPMTDFRPIVVKRDLQSGYSLEIQYGSVSFWPYISGTGWISSPQANLVPDQWNYVTGVYDGTTISLYLNGSLIGTPTSAPGSIQTTNSELEIGGDASYPSRHFQGLIDEAQILNRALSASEIRAMYAAESAGQCGIYTRNEVDKTLAYSGAQVTYTISFNNMSSANFNNVVFKDTLPATLAFIDGSLSATSGTPSYASGVISWAGPVNSGDDVILTFGANISPAAHVGAKIINTASITNGSSQVIRQATVIIDSHRSYQPYIARPEVLLTGKVTANGAPAAGIALDLRFYNGSIWSTLNSTISMADGSYTFKNVPALAAGQSFCVSYLNTTDSRLLYSWYTGVNTTYNGTLPVVFDTFDITNISLGKPDPGSFVRLPYTFTWTVRPLTPTDSYEFDLFNFTDGNPYFYTDPSLGYVGSYKLMKRPAGFLNGVNYGWDVVIYGPDGGSGESYWYYYVKFNSSPGGLASLEPMSGPRLRGDSWAAPGIPADR